MGKDFIPIGQVAKILGVSTQTVRNWDLNGKLKPDVMSPAGRRRYSRAKILAMTTGKYNMPLLTGQDERKTIAYARVSSSDQKEDLERQAKVLEMYCASCGYTFELIKDLGSGMNYHKKGLQKLISAIIDGEVGRLVITHKDRLLRFGAELVFSICEAKGVEVVILNKGDEPSSFEEDLAKDVLEIITVFSARLYGSRSKKNKNLLDKLQKVAQAEDSQA